MKTNRWRQGPARVGLLAAVSTLAGPAFGIVEGLGIELVCTTAGSRITVV